MLSLLPMLTLVVDWVVVDIFLCLKNHLWLGASPLLFLMLKGSACRMFINRYSLSLSFTCLSDWGPSLSAAD